MRKQGLRRNFIYCVTGLVIMKSEFVFRFIYLQYHNSNCHSLSDEYVPTTNDFTYPLPVIPYNSIIIPIFRWKSWSIEKFCYLLTYVRSRTSCVEKNYKWGEWELSVCITHVSDVVVVQPSVTMFECEEFPNNNLIFWMQLRSDFKHFSDHQTSLLPTKDRSMGLTDPL